MGLRAVYDRFDRFQQRHGLLGFPLAVHQKYSEDQGGYLAATIAYYGFFSIFPLLLVFVSVLGFVLRGHPGLQHSIVDSALGQFPVIGDALQVQALRGSGLAIVLGGAAALWSGMGIFLAAENAMNQLWGVPFRRRPDFLRTRARALVLLVLLGAGAIVSTVVGALGTVGTGFGPGWQALSTVLAIGLDFCLFWVAFRTLTSRDVAWRQVRGGAIAAAILYEVLQLLGGYYIGHVLKNASSTYGTFAVVIGLLSWIYLAAHITLLAAEGNVVAVDRLWPRSFSLVFERPPTDADRRALEQRSRVEERRQDQDIGVTFDADASLARDSDGAAVPRERERLE
ncbi:MAG TPA: YihY/virulence factor BrkB family protein [Gaiellaceae bacterium]|jgi:YihY family inner membrane protein|nr:YihY/virulence factor BrkB family protein [Gaiellaceae bacterium]